MGNKKTLLIGCGGSGIKTLTRLNELLASNPNYREEMAEDIAYFVIDTDRNELKGFEDEIHTQMGNSSSPAIARAHITDGYQNLNEIVTSSFDRIKDDEAKTNLMKKYWWYNKEIGPFRGVNIGYFQAGAGQCGQISYLATWNYMPRIKRMLEELIQQIRGNNMGDSVHELQVYIVAGLAGGTGRGSWNLMAFKVRQCLADLHVKAVVNGIFFDASCYAGVTEPGLICNTYFNSYSAVSELSAWLLMKSIPSRDQLKSESFELPFSLPDLTAPDPGHKTDVIRMAKFENHGDSGNLSPIQNAYIVFAENGTTAHLENNFQYHRMAAAALYSMIVHAEPIDAKLSNMRTSLGGFASTTFEIDTYHICAYLETQVRKTFLENQYGEADGQMIQDVAEAIGDAEDPKQNSFLGETHLWLPAEPIFMESCNALNTKLVENPSILQLVMKDLIGVTGLNLNEKPSSDQTDAPMELAATGTLREAFQEQDAEDIKNAAQSLLSFEELRDSRIYTAMVNSLAPVNLDPDKLGVALRERVMKASMSDNGVFSLRRTILFTDELIKVFASYNKILSAERIKINDQFYDSFAKAIEAFAEKIDAASTKTFPEMITFGKSFNKEEIESLCKDFQQFMYAAVYNRMRKVLAEYYADAVNELKKIKGALNDMVEFLKAANVKLDGGLKTAFGDKEPDEIFKELFVDSSNMDSIDASIPQPGELQNVYYRQLKPIFSKEDLKKILSDRNNYWVDSKNFMSALREELQNLLDIKMDKEGRKYDNEEDAEEVLPSKFSSIVERNVGLSAGSTGKSFMDTYFSFEEVLKNNIKCWSTLLKESAGHSGTLFDRFRHFLGMGRSDFEMDEKSHTACKIRYEKVLERIIESLVRNCNPWIEMRREPNVPQTLNCWVILPVEIDDTLKSTLQDNLKELYDKQGYTLSLKILCFGSDDIISRDRIIVYNSEMQVSTDAAVIQMDKILSLDHWRDNPDVLEALQAAEKSDGSSLFFRNEMGMTEKERPMGYVAPFFTLEPLKSLRWHPWFEETGVSDTEAALEKVYRALCYGFLGYGIDETLKNRLAALNCAEPLLAVQEQDFLFKYSPRSWNGEKMAESLMDNMWSVIGRNKGEGALLEHSLDHVVDYLCGKGHSAYGDDKDGKKFRESQKFGSSLCDKINEEADGFFANVFAKLSAEERKQLLFGLVTWMGGQLKKANEKSDSDYWTALMHFAQKKAAEQGIVIK